jgi:hypothetical protein
LAIFCATESEVSVAPPHTCFLTYFYFDTKENMKTSAKNMSTNNKIFIQLSNEAHSMIEIQND